jgi:hypothetical protein
MLDNQCIVAGFCGLLLPSAVTHILRVCMIAKTEFRLSLAREEKHLPKEEALAHIARDEADRAAWTATLFFSDGSMGPRIVRHGIAHGKNHPPQSRCPY